MQDPPLALIENAHEFRIESLRFETAREGREAFVDLCLRRGALLRRLRFFSPQDLVIESGFPQPTHGMAVLDVRHRQLENIGVRVEDFEGAHGAITFWARHVVDLDSVGAD